MRDLGSLAVTSRCSWRGQDQGPRILQFYLELPGLQEVHCIPAMLVTFWDGLLPPTTLSPSGVF